MRTEDYMPGCSTASCPCHVRGDACATFMGADGAKFCPRCGWAEHKHGQQPTRLQSAAAGLALLISSVVPASWRKEIHHRTGGALRKRVLNAAADKLDEQAAAHRESIVDYSDLLRVWADDSERWKDGR